MASIIQLIPWWVLAIDALLRIFIGGWVIMSRRPVSVTLAWLFLLLLPVPFVGVLAYAFVGEVRLGWRRVNRYRRLTEGFMGRATIFWRGRSIDWTTECEPYKHIATVANYVGDVPPLRGNTVGFLAGSDVSIASLIKDIDSAKSRCHLLFYIWQEYGAGELVAAALVRAASRGVTCRVLVDAVGSKAFLQSDLPARMRAAGVKVTAALPVNPLRMLFARVDLRNHRKIVVIDGWTAYAGSQNINDATFGYRPLRKIGPWIDVMVRLEGPAAQALEIVFLRDWEIESDENLGGQLESLLPDMPIPDGGSIVQVVPSGPGPGVSAMREAMMTMLFSAQRELVITTPYFVPDEAFKSCLEAAAMRGVDVTLVVPKYSDGMVVGAASRAHFEDLLRAGVKIKLFRNGLLHSKTITVDSDLAVIGSVNFDMRSFYLNFEVTLFIYDADEASVLRMLQTRYIENSDDVFIDEWRKRPLLQRGGENAARLLGPLL